MFYLYNSGGGGLCPSCKIQWGGLCPSCKIQWGGFCPSCKIHGGDFVHIYKNEQGGFWPRGIMSVSQSGLVWAQILCIGYQQMG